MNIDSDPIPVEAVSTCYSDPNESEPFSRLNLIGEAPPFLHTLDLIKKIAVCDASALVSGETGTGKELVARAIHQLGPRRKKSFIAINCGALPDHLIENELFGHEKGAFTDASTSHDGLVRLAEGGTLFLDEVDSLSLAKGQGTLLRFLQDFRYRPLGSKKEYQADIRIISACNHSLAQLAEQSIFRKDLFFRLNLMTVFTPPLRERKEDIPLLAQHFLIRYQKIYNQPERTFHPQFLEYLRNYSWPGNVRELENYVHRAFLLSDHDQIIHPYDTQYKDTKLPPDDSIEPDLLNYKQAKSEALEKFEKEFLFKIISKTQGNISEAARVCGKDRSEIGKLLKKHKIDKNLFVSE